MRVEGKVLALSWRFYLFLTPLGGGRWVTWACIQVQINSVCNYAIISSKWAYNKHRCAADSVNHFWYLSSESPGSRRNHAAPCCSILPRCLQDLLMCSAGARSPQQPAEAEAGRVHGSTGICGRVSTIQEFRRDEMTPVPLHARPSCPHGCACGLPLIRNKSTILCCFFCFFFLFSCDRLILLEADSCADEGVNAADQHWIHRIIRCFLCSQPTLDHMAVIGIVFSPNPTNEWTIWELPESSGGGLPSF